MTISHCLTMLLDELREAGLTNPLAERFTLAATWDDLCRLAGEERPELVCAALGEGLAAPRSADRTVKPLTVARRGPGKVV